MKNFARHFGFQIAAAVIPSLVILFAVPILAVRVDAQTFAAFAVVISMIGFLSVLDGGIGRTSTYFVKKALTQKNCSSINVTVRSCLLISLVFSLVAMSGIWLLLDWINGPSMIIARDALKTLLFFTPAIVAGSVMKGVLEGQQKFALSSGLQLIHGLAVGITPIIIVNDLDDLIRFSLVVGIVRVLLLIMQIHFSNAKLFESINGFPASIRQILDYNKWLFVSNLVGLSIVFADRLLVAAKFDHHAVSAYILPMEIIARSMIVVSAFVSVMFPRLIDRARGNHVEFLLLVERLKSLVVQLTLAASFMLLPFIDLLLTWWMGSEFVGQSRLVVVVGLVGVAMASSSIISMIGINSLGHTRQIAFLHMAELPLFLGLLYLAAENQNLWLVQIAWITRLLMDTLGMSLILNRIANHNAVSFRGIVLSFSGVSIRDLRSTFLIFVLIAILMVLVQFDASANRLAIMGISLSFALGALIWAYQNAIQLKILFGRPV